MNNFDFPNVYGSYWAPINGRIITWHKDGKIIDIPVGDFGDYLYDLMLECFPVPISGTNGFIYKEDGYMISGSNKMARLYD